MRKGQKIDLKLRFFPIFLVHALQCLYQLYFAKNFRQTQIQDKNLLFLLIEIDLIKGMVPPSKTNQQ